MPTLSANVSAAGAVMRKAGGKARTVQRRPDPAFPRATIRGQLGWRIALETSLVYSRRRGTTIFGP